MDERFLFEIILPINSKIYDNIIEMKSYIEMNVQRVKDEHKAIVRKRTESLNNIVQQNHQEK